MLSSSWPDSHAIGGTLSEVRRNAMPRYEFLCEKCQKPFQLTMTISEREKGTPKCPTCKSTRVAPQLGGFMGQTARKS